MNNEKNKFTVWITGISASGKTTLAKKVIEKIKINFPDEKIILIDGDELRDKIGFHKYEDLDRESIGILKANIAKKENKKGNNVIVTGIAANADWRKEYRKIIQNYYEIFLSCSSEECAKRDYKNQYSKAIDGEIANFYGVSEEYETHDEIDLEINTENNLIEDCVSSLYNFITQIRK